MRVVLKVIRMQNNFNLQNKFSSSAFPSQSRFPISFERMESLLVHSLV